MSRPRKCRECKGLGRMPGMAKVTGMGKGAGSSFGACVACDGVGYVSEAEDDDAPESDEERPAPS